MLAMVDDTRMKPFLLANAAVSNPLRTQVRTGFGVRRKAWIFDIDGTLMLRKPGGRGPYDWDRVHEDVPNRSVVDVAHSLAMTGVIILVVSGRLDVCRKATEASLHRHVFMSGVSGLSAWNSDYLFMRDEARQYMPDDQLKYEIFRHDIQPFFDVKGVFDDRDRVVTMWREQAGLPCFQVAAGNF